MFRQSRNQRTKGSNGKRLFQVSVLLVIVIWLLYETKHSYERKKESIGTDYRKLSLEVADLYFGRKVDPGSENGVGTAEATENVGTQSDAFGSEEEIRKENEGTEEVLHLPNQMDSDSSDRSESKDGTLDSNEENSGNGEATNEAEVGENAGHGSEPDRTGGEREENTVSEVGEHDDNAASVTEEKIVTSTANENQGEETIERRGDAGNAPNDENNTSSSNTEALERDEVESQRADTHEAETNEQHATEAASDKSSDIENNVVMSVETQAAIGKSSMEDATTDTNEGENAHLPNSTENNKDQVHSVSEGQNTDNSIDQADSETNVVMSDNNGDNNGAGSSSNAENAENNEDSRREVTESEQSNASDTEKSSIEVANGEQGGASDTGNSGSENGKAAESHGNDASEAESTTEPELDSNGVTSSSSGNNDEVSPGSTDPELTSSEE